MKNQEHKRLKKAELLEMLVSISEENESLKSEISRLKKMLSEREIRIKKAGSIADAAIAVNNVFRSAQTAAEQYLFNIERLNAETEAEQQKIIQKTREDCLQMEERVKREIIDKLSSISTINKDENHEKR